MGKALAFLITSTSVCAAKHRDQADRGCQAGGAGGWIGGAGAVDFWDERCCADGGECDADGRRVGASGGGQHRL